MKATDHVFENLEDSVIYRFRTIQVQLDHDWTADKPPKHLLEKNWLRLSENAFNDGQFINARVVVRNGHPMLTNSLSQVPDHDLEKMSFKHLLESRITQCKYIQ